MNRRGFLSGMVCATTAWGMKSPLLGRDWDDPASVRYPDPRIEVVDPRFAKYKIGNAQIERLYTGSRWAEGPVWFGDGRYLLWSDIPNNRILRWTEESASVSLFRTPSHYSNGNTRDRQGRLITCEHDSRRLTRTEYDGSISVLMDRYGGKKLNAPNDAVVKSDGSIWFTDPGYGIQGDYEGHQDDFELPTNVYRLDPHTGEAAVLVDDFVRPNGLCFSPDESKLYVADTGRTQSSENPSHVRVFDIDGDRLKNGRVFYDFSPGLADGIRSDTDGNIWCATGWVGEGFDGVQVIAPDGTLIGKILLPEVCANLCFGGVKKNRLFMTASTSLYAAYVNATGAQIP